MTHVGFGVSFILFLKIWRSVDFPADPAIVTMMVMATVMMMIVITGVRCPVVIIVVSSRRRTGLSGSFPARRPPLVMSLIGNTRSAPGHRQSNTTAPIFDWADSFPFPARVRVSFPASSVVIRFQCHFFFVFFFRAGQVHGLTEAEVNRMLQLGAELLKEVEGVNSQQQQQQQQTAAKANKDDDSEALASSEAIHPIGHYVSRADRATLLEQVMSAVTGAQLQAILPSSLRVSQLFYFFSRT